MVMYVRRCGLQPIYIHSLYVAECESSESDADPAVFVIRIRNTEFIRLLDIFLSAINSCSAY